MNTEFDVIIIGGGPAALTAAIYASRGNLKTAFIQKGAPGGKLVYQSKIENWPGIKSIIGADLAINMFEHSTAYGAKYIYGEVTKLISHGDFDKEVHTADGKVYKAKAVVIATGMKERVPEDVENIHEFEHRGVSYCVICDGPLYGHNPSAIIGGGNSAVEEGTFLASVASEVHIFVKGEQFNAEPMLIKELLARENVKVYFNTSVLKLEGGEKLEKAIIDHNGEIKEIAIHSLFPFIGQLPSVTFAKDFDIFDSRGFVKVDGSMETAVKNIFAIGDVIVKDIRQISTAVADGSIVGKVLTNRIVTD